YLSIRLAPRSLLFPYTTLFRSKDEIWTSDSGLITIAGGKLTGYRKMAETVVDLLAKQFAKEDAIRYSECTTKHLPISGGDVGGRSEEHTSELQSRFDLVCRLLL